mmetsp:Transcript_44104/g.64819  ORF Transcript_44104/g.64819 Transcript_44104/m.64819 type:complete len:172 (+) Transcript_44104:1129-1644(+)
MAWYVTTNAKKNTEITPNKEGNLNESTFLIKESGNRATSQNKPIAAFRVNHSGLRSKDSTASSNISPSAMMKATAQPKQNDMIKNSTTYPTHLWKYSEAISSYEWSCASSVDITSMSQVNMVAHTARPRRTTPMIRPLLENAYGIARMPAPSVAEHKFNVAPDLVPDLIHG